MPGEEHSSSDRQPGDEAAFAILRKDVDGSTSVVSVEGELDLATAPRLKWMLMDAVKSERDRIALDLSLTRFIDSTALSVLVAFQRRVDPGVCIAIACRQANVLQIFEFSGTDGAFAIFPTLEDALVHLRGVAAQRA